jgi:branched-subunit amino acid transport protein AzlD
VQLIDKVVFATVLITATQITRLIPLVFEERIGRFIRDERVKTLINDVLFFLLICYCFRDLSMDREYFLRLGVAGYVFLVQFLFERTLLSIFSGTAIYLIGRNL